MASTDVNNPKPATAPGPAVDRDLLKPVRPGIAVVVPAYNAEGCLGACLEALMRQTLPRDQYDVIVVDDGSTDSTPRVAKRYDVQYARQQRSGPAGARNVGARLAKREYVLFTDSDCIPTENWLEEISSSLADGTFSGVRGVYAPGPQTGLVARFAQVEFEHRYRIMDRHAETDMFDTSNAAIRRDVFIRAGGFDEGFTRANNEDTDLGYRLLADGHRLAFNPRAKVRHQGHPDSLWRYWRLKFTRGYWRMHVYQRHPERLLRETYTPWTLKLQCLLVMVLIPALAAFAVNTWIGIGAAGGVLVLFWLSAAPFLVLAVRRDPLVGLVSPLLLLARASALGFGALCGRLFRRSPQSSGQ